MVRWPSNSFIFDLGHCTVARKFGMDEGRRVKMICWIISKMACLRVVRVNRRDRKLGGRGVTTTARVCWRNSYASKMWRGIVS